MIPQLLKAMSKFLRETFPEYGNQIFYDYPEESFKPPCFVIRHTGGNLRRRIRNNMKLKGVTYERFTLEFYSLDPLEVMDVSYQIKVLMDTVEVDNGNLYRCYNKNVMMALSENHASITFNIRTDPYVESEPLTRMTSLDLTETIHEEE